MTEPGLPRRQRSARSIYQVHYGLPRAEREACPLVMPFDSLEIQAYGKQVAGHTTSCDKQYLGLLQCNNGTILKPIIKESQRREIDFYSRLASAADPDLLALRGCVPTYYGCRRFTYNGHEQEYIILEDIVKRMMEPCIMDVKIGKRTWDHLATEEKIQKEQAKYRQCKEQYGFCIPGYQVHRLAGGQLLRYGKDHGKRLHGQDVKDAIRNFLNGGAGLCRALLLQLLAALWKIQKWASRQAALRLRSCSLLLAYDAARLRACCSDDAHAFRPKSKCRTEPIARRKSIHSMHSDAGPSFSGQLSAKGPVYSKVNSIPLSSQAARGSFARPPALTSPWSEALEKINLNHSFDHNYEDKLSKIKMNYRAILDQLSSDSPNPREWGTVKIIDFAHAFFNDEDDMAVDANFRDGINAFVEILESFLKETDDQVF